MLQSYSYGIESESNVLYLLLDLVETILVNKTAINS